MNPPKKPGYWRFLPLVAIVSLATVATIILLPHRSTENTPQTAATPRSQTPRSATAGAPASTPAITPATTPAQAAPPAPGNTAPPANTPPRPPATPAPLPPLALPKNATTTAATTTTTAAAAASPSDAIATLSPRERALLAKIPDARFRDEVLALDPGARFLVFKTLAAKPPPDADYACLHVTPKGMLYYVCTLHSDGAPDDNHHASAPATPAETAPAAASVPITQPLITQPPTTQPPIRHSRPGSRNILFLDFTGMEIRNTSWNEKSAVPVYRAKPYNIENDGDGDPATFSDQEQKNIIEIWERVAEHYSPFDVDVTTERPATFTRTTGHALITSATTQDGTFMPSANNTGVVGVAFIHVFAEYDYATDGSPALIYYDRSPAGNAGIAYTISHELGHNLGLSHQGTVFTAMADDFGYYSGHGSGATSWAPIMGNGFGKSITQWSQGGYYIANNKEDAIAILAGKLGYIGELGSTTLAAATPLAPSGACGGGPLASAGVIRQGGNSHYYTINITTAGSATFALDPGRLTANDLIVGNANLQLDLLNATGSTVTTSNPANTLNATLTHPLTTGTWYLRVTTGSAGNPMSSSPTGYTAYGSIGQYTLATNIVPAHMPLAAALNSDLTWTTEPGSDADWFGQRATTNDGIAAAQSGAIAPGQSTGIVTTVEGSGTLSFHWKIDAHPSDALTFATTDSSGSTTTRATISGTQDWQPHTIPIATTGTHQFGWLFEKPPNSTSGGTAWVDQVTWTPTDLAFTATPASIELLPGASQTTITIETSKTWTAATDADWLTPNPATGNAPATLTIAHAANDTPAPRRATITITSAGINRTIEVAQPIHIPLSTALDNNLVWTTGGNDEDGTPIDAPWTTQTIVTHDGKHAARSAIIQGVQQPSPIPNANTGQQTWLQTTVTGTGIISFWWKVSSEAEESNHTGTWGDILYFHIDGEEHARISGTKNDWANRTFTITGTGTHTLRWVYQKDPYLSVGADAAWLDQVSWTPEAIPTLNISPNALAVPPTNGEFPLIVDSNIPWTATTPASWLAITPSTGTGHATPNLAYTANTTAEARTGIITLTGGGLTVTSTITQDPATLLTLAPATRQVPATTGAFALTVTANTAWDATSNAHWLTIAPATGTAPATLTATHATNTATNPRTATITLTATGTTATCTVTQSAATTSNNGNTNTGGNTGGGGGAPSPWSLLALTLLLALHAANRKN